MRETVACVLARASTTEQRPGMLTCRWRSAGQDFSLADAFKGIVSGDPVSGGNVVEPHHGQEASATSDESTGPINRRYNELATLMHVPGERPLSTLARLATLPPASRNCVRAGLARHLMCSLRAPSHARAQAAARSSTSSRAGRRMSLGMAASSLFFWCTIWALR